MEMKDDYDYEDGDKDGGDAAEMGDGRWEWS